MKIVIAGDFCPHNRVERLINDKKYSDIVSEEVREIFINSDISIVNLECPVIDGNYPTIDKVGPSIKASNNSFGFLKHLGVNTVTLSNNHIMDYGAKGLESTIKGCIDNSISYVGVGESFLKAREPLYIKLKNKTITILNISENEFSTTHSNKPGANPLDLVNNYYDIIEAKKNSDYLILIYHGGHEGYKYPSPRMKKTFRYFIDLGVDLVVCHHSHCYSGYEEYNSKHIYYGLGNFIFDWPKVYNESWNYGYFLEVDTDVGKIDIHPYIQGDKDVQLKLLNKDQHSNFLKELKEINHIILNDDLLSTKFSELVKLRERSYLSLLQPYPGHLISGAYRRGILPNIVSENQLLKHLNISRCEAHLDLYIASIKKNILKDQL